MSPRQPRTGARSRTRRLCGLLGALCVAATLTAGVVTVAGLGIVQARGAQVLVVASGSMEPTFSAGDAVVVEAVRRRDLVPGAVVTFHAPGEPERLTTHRIVERRLLPDGLYLQTRGDANATPDPNFVPAGSVVGVMSTRVPLVGHWLAFFQTPTGRLVVLGTPLAMLVAAQVRATLADLRRRPAVRRPRGPQVAAVAVVVVSLVTGTLVARSTAALFTRQAPVAGNTFATAGYCDPSTTYDAVVLADSPVFHHRFSETTGTTAATTTGNSTGAYTGGVTLGVPGATACEAGAAIRLDGSTGHVVRAGNGNGSPQAPSAFSVEVWFSTRTGGGKLIGFGNERSAPSVDYDRHLYLSATGVLHFGVDRANRRVISSGSRSYLDGRWHHAVGTLGSSGLSLYVDGSLVASDPAVTSAGDGYTGFWRIGQDSLAGWTGASATTWFTGDLDEAAVYPTALSAARVAVHYAEGRR